MTELRVRATAKPRLAAIAAAFLATAATTAALAVSDAGAASSGGVTNVTPSDDDTAAPDPAVSAKYDRLWDRVRPADKRWAHRTSECESGRDPNAIGGGGRYRGAFQFMRSTWKAAPKSPGGDPIDHTYRTQAVVAVALKQRMGSSPWPVCG